MIGIAIASFLLGYILASIFRVGRESDDDESAGTNATRRTSTLI